MSLCSDLSVPETFWVNSFSLALLVLSVELRVEPADVVTFFTSAAGGGVTSAGGGGTECTGAMVALEMSSLLVSRKNNVNNPQNRAECVSDVMVTNLWWGRSRDGYTDSVRNSFQLLLCDRLMMAEMSPDALMTTKNPSGSALKDVR